MGITKCVCFLRGTVRQDWQTFCIRQICWAFAPEPLKNSAILYSGTTLHIISKFLSFHTASEGDTLLATRERNVSINLWKDDTSYCSLQPTSIWPPIPVDGCIWEYFTGPSEGPQVPGSSQGLEAVSQVCWTEALLLPGFIRTLVQTSYIVRWGRWPTSHRFVPFGCGLVSGLALTLLCLPVSR